MQDLLVHLDPWPLSLPLCHRNTLRPSLLALYPFFYYWNIARIFLLDPKTISKPPSSLFPPFLFHLHLLPCWSFPSLFQSTWTTPPPRPCIPLKQIWPLITKSSGLVSVPIFSPYSCLPHPASVSSGFRAFPRLGWVECPSEPAVSCQALLVSIIPF